MSRISPRACGATIVLQIAFALPCGAAEISRDINTYTLFAYEHLSFKGDDTGANNRGRIIGGNVGVNAIDTNPGDSNVLLNMGGGGSPHQVFMSDGTQVAADSARLDSDSSLWNLFTNDLRGGSAPVVRNAGPTPFSGPIISPANLPTLPAFNCNAASPITIPDDGILNLVPGNYGALSVHDDGTLNLGPGIYTVCSLNGGRRVHINTSPGTIVRIAGDFGVNNDSYIGPAEDAQFLVRSDGVGSNDSSVKFSRNSEAHGLFFAPNGILNLGHSSDLYGRFWAKEIGSDFNVNVTYTPEPATLALLATPLLIAIRNRRRPAR